MATSKLISRRSKQIVAWCITSVFLLGLFFPLIGAWTGAVLGVWFVGTQRPLRGFLLQLAFTFVPALVFHWRGFPISSAAAFLQYFGWALLGSLLSVLPFLYHRIVNVRLPGLLSTLPLPVAAGLIESLIVHWLRAGTIRAMVQSQHANALLLQIAAALGVGAAAFLVCWFASVLLWMWNHEFRKSRIAGGASVFATLFLAAFAFGLIRQIKGATVPASLPVGTGFSWFCLLTASALTLMALLLPRRARSWAERPETVAILQSPYTREPVHVVTEGRREFLVTNASARFAIRNGMPVFLKAEDLAGKNLKYNHLYETLGGFYDDIQRVSCAFRGIDMDSYFLTYMSRLEVKSDDSVLETSVGTGLNFKYLPRGVKLSGLDLSLEMLINCQANLRRWEMEADLYLGNAEALPFADSSFDVVFHVGGINFFSDRGAAIREMIRVAKPGSRLLIADETEEHVKVAYEPGLAAFRNRAESVTAPVDLVPPEMEEIHLELVKNDRCYVLTFRKPALETFS